MFYTEEEALGKLCPASFNNPEGHDACQGKACMKWEQEYHIVDGLWIWKDRGRCGL